eukprot:RCo022175
MGQGQSPALWAQKEHDLEATELHLRSVRQCWQRCVTHPNETTLRPEEEQCITAVAVRYWQTIALAKDVLYEYAQQQQQGKSKGKGAAGGKPAKDAAVASSAPPGENTASPAGKHAS